MKKHLYSILLLSILLSSCQESSNSNVEAPAPVSYEEAKLTVEQQEQQNPTDFLKVSGTYRQNLIDEWVVEGEIKSNATTAKYKDPVLTLEYYSETNTLLGSEECPIYKFINPGEILPFKIKRNGFDGTKSIRLGITGASAAE